ASVGLPTADVSSDSGPFFVAEVTGRIVGTAGIEPHGAAALLRSVAAAPPHRGKGTATRLCVGAMHRARPPGVLELYLLITTAAAFFEKLVFARLARAAAPPSIQRTREFRDLCPDSSTLMHKQLGEDDGAVARMRDAYARFLAGEPGPLIEILA